MIEVPEISIIVPVYKVEKYLKRCVDSVLNQTFKDYECILVDDGSPDNCPEMCDEYEKTYDQIKVIHKNNGGLSDARNAGLKICTGEYVMFLDSDDWVHPQILEILFNVIKKSNAGFAVCKMINSYEYADDFENFDFDKVIKNIETYSSEQILNNFTDYFWKIGPFAWGKLYKRSCFDNLFYNTSMSLYEDEYMYADIVEAAGSVSVVNEKLYFYFQSSDSLIRGRIDERFFCTFSSLQHISDFMKERNIIDEMNLFELRWMMGYMDLYYRIKSESPVLMKKFREYTPKFRKKIVPLLKNPKLTKAYKLLLVLFVINPSFARRLYKQLTK